MKLILSVVIAICFTYIGHSQNATISIGRGTDCFGRGACSINTLTPESYNATMFQNSEGETTLRIHREKLSSHDENRILGHEITPQNQSYLQFQMLDSIQFDEEVKQLTSTIKSRQLNGIPEGIYAVEITSQFIDIILSKKNTSLKPD